MTENGKGETSLTVVFKKPDNSNIKVIKADYPTL